MVKRAIRELRAGKVDLADLEYRVELREDTHEKSRKTLPQPYHPAWLLSKVGKKASRGEIVGFVKALATQVQATESAGLEFSRSVNSYLITCRFEISLYSDTFFDPLL
jgi:hypothetical protein